MFLIYKSNRLDLLIHQACNIIKKNPLSNPLQHEIFLVNNVENTQWIKICIAEKLKISANIKFFTISDFIWKFLEIFIPDNIHLKKLHKSSIVWKIMTLIEEKEITNLIDKKDAQLKKFMFASHLSELFEQYLIYRPDWFDSWEKNNNFINSTPEKKWQKKIWNKLTLDYIKNKKYSNILNILPTLLKKINISKSTFKYVPFRFFICNISDVPISHLSILYSLSKNYQIYLLMTTPYVNHKFITKKENNEVKLNLSLYSKEKYHNLYEQYHQLDIIDQVNPLLLSCGQYGYEYICFLFFMKNKYTNCYTSTYKNNLLNTIQKNILKPINKKKNKKNTDKKIKKIIFNPKDKSISIHICYNLQREIEILHDNLLYILNKDPLILPKDIIVKSFQLHLYIPFINSVFNSTSKKNRIPFIIFNELSDKNHEIISVFNKLLHLEKNRLYNQEIFNLLQISELAKNFRIDNKDLSTLFTLICESGIRWGLDKKHIKNLSLPNNVKCTWEYGIKKIMLGYSMNNKHIAWENTFPYNIENKSNIKLICKIINLVKMLHKWKKKLSTPKLLKTWLPLCRQLINDFFYKSDETENIFNKIEEKWIKIVHTGIQLNYKKKFLFQYYEINYP
ncbi:exodeoxyribonuclease V subunit gamma [Buchnera aphidicola]|uniref:exodeoxyribonuclease V subunit gamma n=1 Tax=Buchnera aphidicola TaxID=9 RepID=UPI002AA2B2B7|nr:exodeoxyribonuclease V subunit gamma [Buchnera aphidicola]